MMSETLGNTLHVPCEVATFNDQGGCVPVVHLIRNFNEKLVPKDKMIGRFSSAMRSGMSGNGDGDHILAAFDRLIARPEKRKLLIVFSDGQPAGWSGYGDGGWYTGHVIKQIENESPVEIVGIGIQDESVVHYYKNHRVIRNADGLETALLSVIEEHLK
jgi:cobalamin biosynthesis protein CobT